MVDEATLQVQLPSSTRISRRLAAGVIKEYPDGRREAGALNAPGGRAGSAESAASPPRARLIDSAATHPDCRRVLSGYRRPYIPDNAGRAGEKGDGGAMQTLRQ